MYIPKYMGPYGLNPNGAPAVLLEVKGPAVLEGCFGKGQAGSRYIYIYIYFFCFLNAAHCNIPYFYIVLLNKKVCILCILRPSLQNPP